MTTEKPAAALSTSDGARCYIAHFFAREIGRHNFATYIATELAADFACALAQHLAARQPGAQEPVATATQPGKRVSILESACGPARKFDPVAADAELASVPLVPLWELPELHPRKVASECLTTMEQVRRATRPNTINRVKLTDSIALVGRFVVQMERSERLGTAPPAQGINLAARPMDTAPRDGTLLRLLVDFDENAIEDSISATWTIGACNDDNVSEGARIGWQFAGWCWTHDHFTEGKGTPVGWLPLIDIKAVGK